VAGRGTSWLQPDLAISGGVILQVNEVLEVSLMQLQQRNNPHAEAVAAALNRTGSADAPAGSLLMSSSPLRARAAEAAGTSQGARCTGCWRAAVHAWAPLRRWRCS
jgi:hypothetical protein